MNKYNFPKLTVSKNTAEFRGVFKTGICLSLFMLLQVMENTTVLIVSYFTTSWNYRYC